MAAGESRRGYSVAAAEGYVTGDMVAQWAYCPRRLFLMYVDGRWADNAYTEEGSWVHRRVDVSRRRAKEDDVPRAVRSLELEDPVRRLRARLDLLEWDDETDPPRAVPVEYKRGKVPPSGRPYAPERLQVAVQAALLLAQGYRCEQGVVYYAQSRRRVPVPVDAGLLRDLDEAVEAVRRVLGATEAPPPLQDSPKCPKCSLVEICLPDETNLLRTPLSAEVADRPMAAGTARAGDAVVVRRLLAPRDDRVPLYVQEQGARVRLRGERFVVTKGDEELGQFRLIDVSQVVLCGYVSMTSAALHAACRASIPVLHLSMRFWFYGMTVGPGLRNAFDRAAQFSFAADETRRLALARAIVEAKGRNQRTLLRRNGKRVHREVDAMRRALRRVDRVRDVEALLGLEGELASYYFQAFSRMLRPRTAAGDPDWTLDFSARNRRPPKDPVNALLSFGYALLVRDATVALWSVGLDPFWGVYHRPRHGRPALALDLMEEFRPLVVDSAVITAINTGRVGADCFVRDGQGCLLNAKGRKAFLRAYAARMDQLFTHPIFGYRVSWRRALNLQAQLMARVFRGEIPTYPGITVR